MARTSSATAFEKALALVARRDHGTEELRRKLAGKGYPREQVDDAIDRMVALGYLDDRRVLRQAAAAVFRRRKGLVAVRAWLLSHGFERSLVDEFCTDCSAADDELVACRAAVDRLGGAGDGAARALLVRRLERRGFRPETIAKVLNGHAD